MWHLKLAVWICSELGLSCAVGAMPTLSTIQAAYEREASSGSGLHDSGLKVIDSKCHDNSNGPLLCEVRFVSAADPAQRLYFDIVAVDRTPDGWKLKSGLCKR
jgi:hypothetical protein